MKYIIVTLVSFVFFSYSDVHKDEFSSDSFELNMDILTDRFNNLSFGDHSADGVLLDEYIIKLTNQQGAVRYAVAFDYTGRVYADERYLFNQWIVVDEDYNIKELRVFFVGLENKVFQTDVSSILSSYIWNLPYSKAENHVVLEMNGDSVTGKRYGQVDDEFNFWKDCGVFKDSSAGESGEKCTSWYYHPTPDIRFKRLLFTNCERPTSKDRTSIKFERTDFLANCKVKERIFSSEKLLKKYVVEGRTDSYIGTVSPEIWASFVVRTRNACAKNCGDFKYCDQSAAAYIVNKTEGLYISNLQSWVDGYKSGVYAWSARLNCDSFSSKELNCHMNYNEVVPVVHENIPSEFVCN